MIGGRRSDVVVITCRSSKELKTRERKSLARLIVAALDTPRCLSPFGHGANAVEETLDKAVHRVEQLPNFVVAIAYALQSLLQGFVVPILRALHERSGAFRRWKRRRRFESRFGRALEFGWIGHNGSR